MTYPPPSGGWNDPAWSGQQSSPPADPTLPVSGQPIPTQPTGADPYAPADPYAGGQQVPGQQLPGQQFPGQPGSTDPYAAPGHPAQGYPAPGYPAPGYPAYGYPPAPPQSGLAIASMVVSIIGALGLCGYGLGGYIGIVGAILGHVARRQINERGEGGAGFATAGIIVGWISTAIAVLATVAFVIFFVWLANQDPSSLDSGTTY